jgi:hypothetical protein
VPIWGVIAKEWKLGSNTGFSGSTTKAVYFEPSLPYMYLSDSDYNAFIFIATETNSHTSA